MSALEVGGQETQVGEDRQHPVVIVGGGGLVNIEATCEALTATDRPGISGHRCCDEFGDLPISRSTSIKNVVGATGPVTTWTPVEP